MVEDLKRFLEICIFDLFVLYEDDGLFVKYSDGMLFEFFFCGLVFFYCEVVLSNFIMC